MPAPLWIVFAALPVVLALVAWRFPRVPLLFARLAYRLSVYHPGRVPAAGPALLVANHVTALDWLFIRAACRRRVRFAARPEDAARRLAAGHAVAVFPESELTRNGAMLPFGPDIDRIQKLAGIPVPVVPVFLDNLWGSVWSWSGGRRVWKWPETLGRRRVAVYFGEPLTHGPTAAEVRAAVQEAGADCGIAESRKLRPVVREFVRQASSARHLFRRAFVDSATGTERVLTWGRVLVGAWALRNWLATRIGPGQNVALWLPTGLGSALANVALGMLGRTTVNLNYTAGPDLVESAVTQAGVDTILTARRFVAKVPLVVPAGVRVIHIEDAQAGISAWTNLARFVAVVVLPGRVLDRWVLRLGRIDPESPATILFSSGSTGEPKGVVLSHRNVAANVDGFRRGVQFTRHDRMLVTLPFFHSFGHTVSLWATLTVGMEAVFHPDPRQAKEVGELCRKHRCSILLGTATFLRLYLRRAELDSFTSLRLAVCGAEKLPVPLQEEFLAKFGVRPLEGYGCTELSPVATVNIPDVTVGGVTQRGNAPGTVGQPIPTVAVKAFDPDTLDPLPHGTVGMLGVKGPNVMLGYLGRPDLTARVVRGGWYLTGDVGKVEDDGFVRITGRISRFAKIAGEMVPLERLDDEMHELLGHPPDRVLAVAAVPCDRRGERVVVLHLGSVTPELERVFADLRARGLPNLWIPDKRDCHAVEAFPVLGTGKLDLRRLGDLARELDRTAVV